MDDDDDDNKKWRVKDRKASGGRDKSFATISIKLLFLVPCLLSLDLRIMSGACLSPGARDFSL